MARRKNQLFGERPPDVPPVPAATKNSWQYLLEDLNEEQHSAAGLIEQAQSLREEVSRGRRSFEGVLLRRRDETP